MSGTSQCSIETEPLNVGYFINNVQYVVIVFIFTASLFCTVFEMFLLGFKFRAYVIANDLERFSCSSNTTVK